MPVRSRCGGEAALEVVCRLLHHERVAQQFTVV